MSKTINIGQPLFNNIEGHPFVLGPQGPYRTKEEAKRKLIAFYEKSTDIPDGQECIIDGVKFIWRNDDLYESLAVKTINKTTNLNDYTVTGNYRFNGIRNKNFANLPINNNNDNASITGELFVYSSVEGTTTYRSIIGQTLFLSNAEGHETKIYTRSANKTSKDGGVTYKVTWGDWQVCQGMKEVGVVDSYDSFIDNGMYSGVYNNGSTIETFVIITINDYVVKSQLGAPKSISQLKYGLNAINNKSELSVRVGKGEPLTWSEWKPIFDAESITTQITNIQNQLNTLTEGTSGNINDIVNKAINNIVGGAPEAYDTLKEIVDYVNKNKDEVTGQVTDIIASLNELQNLKIMDLGGNFAPDKVNASLINYVKTNNIKHAILFKYLDLSQSSVFGVCISRDISRDSNNQEHPSGWIIYLLAKKGIERLLYNSAGTRETLQEYGGILRHQQNAIKDGQLETMSVNGLKSLIVDNLNANETLDNTRKILSILSANQGRILDEKINTKHPILVPGANIKNINGQSILGEGNIEIKPGITEEEKKILNDKIDSKAPKVGYAPNLKVNFAKELVGRGEATEEVIGGIRPTGVRSIGDGNATITKIKGESVVWNQLVNHSHWKSTTNNGVTFTVEDDGKIVVNGTATGLARIMINPYFGLKANHKYALTGTPNNSNGAVLRYFGTGLRDEGNGSILNITTDAYNALAIEVTEGVSVDNAIFYPQFHDLTLMFGAGNEPTTIEEFEARKPLGVTDEYNEGTIVSYDGDALRSVGFNAYNGTYAKVIGGEVYHATGTTSVSFAKELGGDTTPITLDSNGKFTPTEDGYVYAEGKNIVIHLTHSYTPDHVDEYEEDVHVLPDVQSILDANGNQLFPNGLLSAGSVHDEITATKAIKRVGVVDMGDLTWRINDEFGGYDAILETWKENDNNRRLLTSKYSYKYRGYLESDNKVICSIYYHQIFVRDSSYTSVVDFKAAMQGIPLYYELTTPIEVDLPEPLNMTYEAWDFGTEELVAKGATTPLNADIVYQFNAVDRIRENSKAIDVLEEHVEERKDDGIELLTNGNLKLTLKGETREFMPATPSGDPMHWAYVSAGAEYNATTSFIVVNNVPWENLVDPIAYKAQWNLDIVADNLVQSDSITYNGVSYRYAKDTRTSPTDGTQPRYRIVVKDDTTGKWVWDDTKVLHLPNRWYLNGLGDITNEEIRQIYNIEKRDYSHTPTMIYYGTLIRTATFRAGKYSVVNLNLSFASTSKIEIVNLDCLTSFTSTLYSSVNVRHLITKTQKATLEYQDRNTSKNELSTTAMSTANLSNMKYSLDMSNSLALSRKTVLQLINTVFSPSNSPLTKALTITLHPDAYARLVDDTEIKTALETKNAALEGTGGSISLVSA